MLSKEELDKLYKDGVPVGIIEEWQENQKHEQAYNRFLFKLTTGKLTPEEKVEYLTFLAERISVRLSEDYD